MSVHLIIGLLCELGRWVPVNPLTTPFWRRLSLQLTVRSRSVTIVSFLVFGGLQCSFVQNPCALWFRLNFSYHRTNPCSFYFDKSEARSKYWQHVSKFYNLDVTRRFDLSHLPPICVHIMYERQLLQGLTLAIVNFTDACKSLCIYFSLNVIYLCWLCLALQKYALFNVF